jgi:predicted AAA+ superfamily ATPase
MEYKRPVFYDLYRRFKEETTLIQVISGPRQVGKTTLVQQLFKEPIWNGIYAIADGIQNDTSWIEMQFNRAVLLQKTSDTPVIIALDEIQKIPNWSETIKKLYDQQRFSGDTNIQWIILGSSHWLLQKGLSESLAGRFEQWNISHWRFEELQEAFGLTPEEYVFFGAYPGAMSMRTDETRWKSYIRQSLIETVITKDVLLMHTIEKPALLRKLFELGTMYSGQILSFTKIMGQLQDAKNTTTIAHYLELLEHAGLLTGLQKFAMDQARKRSSSPKWQTMNNALFSALISETFEESMLQKTQWGRMVESAVGTHLLAHQGSDLGLYYWNESHAEVDFIIQKGNTYIALEVKTGHDKITGLNKFSSKFKPHKVYQLSSEGLTWQEFLTINPRDLF